MLIINFPGANAQNTGANVQASVPGKPVSMPATNLNIGMDLWNATPAGAGGAKMRANPSGAPSAAGADHWIQVRIFLLSSKLLFCNHYPCKNLHARMIIYVYII